MRYNLILLFFISFLFSACGIFDGTDAKESKIHFKPPNLITTASEGSNVHQINDFWVTVGNQDLGVWPIDRTVPFLPQNDPELVTVFAGVKNNGVFTSSIIYPYYEIIKMEKSFVEGQVDTMTLDFNYTDNAEFSLVEDFEGIHVFTNDEDDDPDSFVEIEEIDGSNVAVLRVMPDHEIVDVSSSTTYPEIKRSIDPGSTGTVFIEMEYMAETTFAVGLVAIDGNGNETNKPFIILKAQSEWNKVYLNVTDELFDTNTESYRIRFTLLSSTATAEEAIYLDNIKLIHS